MAMAGSGAATKFGSCCEDLKDALAGEEFEPLITVDDDVLYMSVGLLEVDDDNEPNMIDHPIFFCPFCGTKVQTPDEVDAKVKS
jgi:hypothetical protein